VKLSDSQYPLKKVFYRMFSLLVVVPLIVVFAAAAVILYQVMRTSAVDTISAFQETVAPLNTDIKSASLQLSHFVYVNDGEFLDVANRVYSSSGSSQQYLAAKELERSLNTAMVPSQNILAGLFFMKGGGTVPVKESITLPDDALRAECWYRTALDNPNRVTIGGYDTSKTDLTANAQKGGQLRVAAAPLVAGHIKRYHTHLPELLQRLVNGRAALIQPEPCTVLTHLFSSVPGSGAAKKRRPTTLVQTCA
jgi:two-component system sensor histidine kinase YesM